MIAAVPSTLPPLTWRPIDVSDVLDGTWQPPRPTVGRCHKAPGLLYPGRRHDLYAESEAGKTWLALLVAADVLAEGGTVVYLDFEDDAGGIVGRLLAMATPPASIGERFAYIRPESPITAPAEREVLAQALGDLQPALAVLDGRTEAMALHGLSITDNDDTAKFGRLVERPLTETGAAFLGLDHVTKDRENRGRYAIGAVHKLNGLNGAAFSLENRSPLGDGLTGRSTLRITKDRPGQLRRHALPGREGTHWLGDLVVDATVTGFVDVALMAPIERPADFRPTVLMKRVSDALAGAPDPLNVRGVLDRVTGKADATRAALARLVDEGYVVVEKGPRGAQNHRLVKPFEVEE